MNSLEFFVVSSSIERNPNVAPLPYEHALEAYNSLVDDLLQQGWKIIDTRETPLPKTLFENDKNYKAVVKIENENDRSPEEHF